MTPSSKYVLDIMTPNPVVVGPETRTGSAERLAKERSVHDLLVLDQYQLTGVVCLCDLFRNGTSRLIRDCMRKEPITIEDQETANTAERVMTERAVGCLPVVDWSGMLRGIVTRHDLVKAGVVRDDVIRTCRTCGSAHGLPRGRAALCVRCADRGRGMPMAANDAGYLSLGGA